MTNHRTVDAPNGRNGQAETIAFLERPENYPGNGPEKDNVLQDPSHEQVTRIDTHAAMVFLVGDKAVKIKRAVRYPYLDFSTLAKRRRACQRELVLNRRSAPQLYDGLLAVMQRADGTLAFAGPFEVEDPLPDGEVVEWALLMKRFDGETLFSELANRGALTSEMIDDLTTEILRYHEKATRLSPAPEKVVKSLSDLIADNLADFRKFADCFPADAVAAHAERLDAELARQAPLLQKRAKAGFLRHCHGDLHLGNICLWDGKPLLFDCLEFDDALAEIDLLYDLAFLFMDLIQRGLPAFANQVMNAIAQDEQAIEGLALLPLFLSMRAAVRAKVAATLAAALEDPEEKAKKAAEARAYFAAADADLQPAPPRLIAVGGLSGSGKTSLARVLAPQVGAPPGALHLRSDLLRKAHFGVAPLIRLPPSAYRSNVSAAVYEKMYELAAVGLKAGRTVIVDAVFNHPESRARLPALAAAYTVPFQGLWLQAPSEVLAARVDARRDDASDATVDVVKHQLQQDCGEIAWPQLDSSQEASVLRAKALKLLS